MRPTESIEPFTDLELRQEDGTRKNLLDSGVLFLPTTEPALGHLIGTGHLDSEVLSKTQYSSSQYAQPCTTSGDFSADFGTIQAGPAVDSSGMQIMHATAWPDQQQLFAGHFEPQDLIHFVAEHAI